MRKIESLYIEGDQETLEELFRKIRDKLGRGINVVEINTKNDVKCESDEVKKWRKYIYLKLCVRIGIATNL